MKRKKERAPTKAEIVLREMKELIDDKRLEIVILTRKEEDAMILFVNVKIMHDELTELEKKHGIAENLYYTIGKKMEAVKVLNDTCPLKNDDSCELDTIDELTDEKIIIMDNLNKDILFDEDKKEFRIVGLFNSGTLKRKVYERDWIPSETCVVLKQGEIRLYISVGQFYEEIKDQLRDDFTKEFRQQFNKGEKK